MHDLAARNTLDDCRTAVDLLKGRRGRAEWRIYFVAAVTLVRAVGHVLKEIDEERSSAVKLFVETEWPLWKKEAIYKHFIEVNRNAVIKRYNFPARPVAFLTQSGHRMRTQSGALMESQSSMMIETGHFAGREYTGLLDEAIEWWNDKLKMVESVDLGV